MKYFTVILSTITLVQFIQGSPTQNGSDQVKNGTIDFAELYKDILNGLKASDVGCAEEHLKKSQEKMEEQHSAAQQCAKNPLDEQYNCYYKAYNPLRVHFNTIENVIIGNRCVGPKEFFDIRQKARVAFETLDRSVLIEAIKAYGNVDLSKIASSTVIQTPDLNFTQLYKDLVSGLNRAECSKPLIIEAKEVMEKEHQSAKECGTKYKSEPNFCYISAARRLRRSMESVNKTKDCVDDVFDTIFNTALFNNLHASDDVLLDAIISFGRVDIDTGSSTETSVPADTSQRSASPAAPKTPDTSVSPALAAKTVSLAPTDFRFERVYGKMKQSLELYQSGCFIEEIKEIKANLITRHQKTSECRMQKECTEAEVTAFKKCIDDIKTEAVHKGCTDTI